MPINEALVADAVEWAKAMGERGLYSKSSARFRASALQTLSRILADDEPQTAIWMLENLDSVVARWTTLQNANPGTARTYSSRARTALQDYLDYRNDPSSFKGRSRSTKSKSRPTTKAARRPKDKPVAQAQPIPQLPASPASRLRTFPITAGEIKYELPAEFSVKDALKVFCHLITFADDFDPTNPKQARIFALTRIDED
jgi:hypothetical protein